MGLTTRLTIFTPILLSLAACLGSNEGTGALTVAGTITADGLTASMTGTIFGEKDEPLAVSGQFEGDFRGADAEVVAGVGELDVERDETMDAVFVANRDE